MRVIPFLGRDGHVPAERMAKLNFCRGHLVDKNRKIKVTHGK